MNLFEPMSFKEKISGKAVIGFFNHYSYGQKKQASFLLSKQ